MTDSRIPTLTTERLVLRPFERGDLDDLVPIHADPSFWWYPLRGPDVGGGHRAVPRPRDRALRERRLRRRGRRRA